jgi:predicted ATPase
VTGDIGVRRTEMAEIERALDRAESGQCSVVIIDGEAGIGKSHLLASGADGVSSSLNLG